MVLRKGQISRIKTKKNNVCVHVPKGNVWITTPEDGRDVLLTAGADRALQANGELLIEAFDESEIILC